ncbi:MAG: tRNA threonylcarbamoyladenosine dehydratase [Clostridia bacterium]|jgi:tRNA A37 threonylcarbamoyladenosine dehydratase|nr:tRNA threonylcarbamoyladenosine dehydratase [Clostridia bacterium]
MNIFQRTEMIIGEEKLNILKNSKVVIFGIGGVGGFVVEGLVRAGIGKFVLVDNDTIDETNLNRQIHATNNTIGKNKVDVMKERILSINKDADVEVKKVFFLQDSEEIITDDVDYVVDSLDTVTAKIEIVMRAQNKKVPLITSLGTGNKMNPTMFEISDIYKTEMCPLAKVMRKELKNRGIRKLKVLYSKEKPVKTGSSTPGSISFVPSVAGLIIASEVVKDLIKYENK